MLDGPDIAFTVVETLLVVLIIIGLYRCGFFVPDNAAGRAPARVAAAAAAAAAPDRAAPPVRKLPYFPYSAQGRRASEKLVCAICLAALLRGELCSQVPACRHLFHSGCVEVWMKSKNTCPLCRAVIVTGSAEPVSAADGMV